MSASEPLERRSPPPEPEESWASLHDLLVQAFGDILRLVSKSGLGIESVERHGADFDTILLQARAGEDGVIHLAHVMEVKRAVGSADELVRLIGQPVNSRVLRDLATLSSRLREYYEPEVIPDWLQGESPDLAGRKPIELVREGRLVEVLAVLEAQVIGSFA